MSEPDPIPNPNGFAGTPAPHSHGWIAYEHDTNTVVQYLDLPSGRRLWRIVEYDYLERPVLTTKSNPRGPVNFAYLIEDDQSQKGGQT